MTSDRPRAWRTSPSLVVFLSFLWPGLGQLAQGRRRTALLYAAPVAVVVLLLVVRILGGAEAFAVSLLDPTVALTLLILTALMAIWRLISMVDALVTAMRNTPARSPALPVAAVLATIVIASHLWLGNVTWAFYDAGSQIFVGDRGPDGTPPAEPSDGRPEASDNAVDFQATPFPTPATASNRITILVTGIDSGHGRNHSLTDTLMLISVDPDTSQVAMLSFPRDISEFSLFNGGTYHGKINSFMTYARLHPDQFPDGGLPSLAKEIGYLAGVPVGYFAAINLDGFTKMIDLVGGVDVVNPKAIDDPKYDWFNGTYGFHLAAGSVHLDGRSGLAYVRSRQGVGDNDFTRAARQQQVLQALRKKLTSPAVIGSLPDLVRALGSSVRTNYPAGDIERIIAIGTHVTDDSTFKKVLGPPYATSPPPDTTGGVYTLVLDMNRIAKLSVELFGSDSRYAAAATSTP
ncbi:MAG TPA: LCP family protein [Candidatus Limnocylindrales bacterium]|nr:LCP family protein [Candidatus Limnocylindrales bacterium]